MQFISLTVEEGEFLLKYVKNQFFHLQILKEYQGLVRRLSQQICLSGSGTLAGLPLCQAAEKVNRSKDNQQVHLVADGIQHLRRPYTKAILSVSGRS